MKSNEPLQVWINHVFDHSVADHPWYYEASRAMLESWTADGEGWPEAPENIAVHIADTFEHAGELLGRFSDEQLDQGFWYFFYKGPPDFMGTLLEERIPLAYRLRALRSFVPLFEQVMAVRCTSHLAHLNEKGCNALNSACYMWFDELPDRTSPEKLVQAKLEMELVATLRTILAIPHDACRESALHGIGH